MRKKREQLTAERKKVVQVWINEKWKGKKLCPICQDNNWFIGDHFVMPVTLTENIVTLGGPSYPQVMINCLNCGHTLLFNSVIMGFSLQEDEEKDKDEEQSSG